VYFRGSERKNKKEKECENASFVCAYENALKYTITVTNSSSLDLKFRKMGKRRKQLLLDLSTYPYFITTTGRENYSIGNNTFGSKIF
jgi:hypothetical protein